MIPNNISVEKETQAERTSKLEKGVNRLGICRPFNNSDICNVFTILSFRVKVSLNWIFMPNGRLHVFHSVRLDCCIFLWVNGEQLIWHVNEMSAVIEGKICLYKAAPFFLFLLNFFISPTNRRVNHVCVCVWVALGCTVFNKCVTTEMNFA